jgi:hypothetical protein
MNGYLMLEVARQRMADREAAAQRAIAVREHRAALRRERAAAGPRRAGSADRARALVPAPREPVGSAGRSRAGR